ncbi:MAG: cupin domain-containing protein [Solirubrobacteraceae bacterium]
MTATASTPRVLTAEDGLRLQSGPGRELVFKLTGDDTGGALDYFIVEVAPHGAPPLHVHHHQEETIHVLRGRLKVQIGEQLHTLEQGGFAYLPSGLPHAFLNLTDQRRDHRRLCTRRRPPFLRRARTCDQNRKP